MKLFRRTSALSNRISLGGYWALRLAAIRCLPFCMCFKTGKTMVLCQVCETKVQEVEITAITVESFQNGKSKYKFTPLDHHYCQNCNIEIPVHSTQMASNELKPGANAQCSTRLMRFELSTEAFDFYGSAEVLRKRQEFYGRATFLRNSDDELDFTEEARDCFHRTAIFLRNDRRFARNDCRILKKQLYFYRTTLHFQVEAPP